jgi:hypothetical protein
MWNRISGGIAKTTLAVITSMTFIIAGAQQSSRFVSFTGKDFSDYQELTWNTADEAGIQRFVVEASADGRTFDNIGEVAATNNEGFNTYTYRNQLTTREVWFYRILVLYKNGEIAYSSHIRLGSSKAFEIKVYPTVLTSGAQLNINSNMEVDRIDVVSTGGQMMFSKLLNGQQGYLPIGLPSLPRGMYFVKITTHGSGQTEKIIIQ